MNRSKLYTRREPSREGGKLYFVFCEGEKRETTYFYFFNRLASQIIIQIVPVGDGKNSPMGLYRNAHQCLTPSETNPEPEYDIRKGDEVWFVIDTDKWGDEILELRAELEKHEDWYVAQSNPCFEVWLYYHFESKKPPEAIDNWKNFVNSKIAGGFDNRKHPAYIETAIGNSEHNFTAVDGCPDWATTELFRLGKKILPLVKKDIDILFKKP
jgi:hypothetical protein